MLIFRKLPFFTWLQQISQKTPWCIIDLPVDWVDTVLSQNRNLRTFGVEKVLEMFRSQATTKQPPCGSMKTIEEAVSSE